MTDSTTTTAPTAPADPFPSETPNGIRKRYEYMVDVLRRFAPRRVLDFGCGTGTNLTIPLAEAFPEITFLGVDSDATTVDFANTAHGLPNLTFGLNEAAALAAPFDMIIASEVIEHVDEPGGLLLYFHDMLEEDGVIVLTMPNGRGPFEMTAFGESLLYIVGVHRVMYWVAGTLLGRRVSRKTQADTLAVSPHVNFFSWKRITGLMRAAGFTIAEFRSRTFVCGLGFHQMLFTEGSRRWNARVADKLPAFMTSGWMFIARKTAASVPAEIPYKRTMYERARKWLNAKRWGVA